MSNIVPLELKKINSIKLVRTHFSVDYTFGYLEIDGKKIYYTWEDPDIDYLKKNNRIPNDNSTKGCIPKESAGTAVWSLSPRFGDNRVRLELSTNPGNRRGILIHEGNNQYDTEGCILIGLGVEASSGTGKLLESRKAVQELYTVFDTYSDTIAAFKIEQAADAVLVDGPNNLPTNVTIPRDVIIPAGKLYNLPTTTGSLASISNTIFCRYSDQAIILKLRDSLKNFTLATNASITTEAIQFKNFLRAKLENPNLESFHKAINKMLGVGGLKKLINIENHKASQLVPYVRLYRVEQLKDGTQENIEFFFEPYVTNAAAIGRNFGYGFKEFKWTDASGFVSDVVLKADLSLKFDSLDSLTRVRNKTVKDKRVEYSFLQLIYNLPLDKNGNPGGDQEKKELNITSTKEPYKIKIVVGWNETGDGGLDPMLKASRKVLYMYCIGHDIKINKDGTIDLDLKYRLAQERESKDKYNSNIFRNYEKAKNRIQKQKEETEKAKKEFDEFNASRTTSTATGEIKAIELKEKLDINSYLLETLFGQESKNLYSDFINQMIGKGAIRFFSVQQTELDALRDDFTATINPTNEISINSFPYWDDITSANKNVIPAKDVKFRTYDMTLDKVDDVKTVYDGIITDEGDGKVIIPYFFLGDLFDAALENINSGRTKASDIIRFITGPIVLEKEPVNLNIKNRLKEFNLKTNDINHNNVEVINLADLPISFREFFDWFYVKLCSNNEIEYSFMQLVNDLCREVLPTMLTPWAFGKRYENGSMDFTSHILGAIAQTTSSKSEKLIDPITGRDLNKFGGDPAGKEKDPTIDDLAKNLSELPQSDEDPGTILQYIYIQGRYIQHDSNLRFIDEDADAKENIYHLKVGTYNGLVKSINFTKEENPYIPVANYINQGGLNLGFFRTTYRTSVEMIGNTIFKPGMTVFIDPAFMLTNTNSDAAEKMGLSSYHMILQSSSTIGVGGYRTTLSTKSTIMGTKNRKKLDAQKDADKK